MQWAIKYVFSDIHIPPPPTHPKYSRNTHKKQRSNDSKLLGLQLDAHAVSANDEYIEFARLRNFQQPYVWSLLIILAASFLLATLYSASFKPPFTQSMLVSANIGFAFYMIATCAYFSIGAALGYFYWGFFDAACFIYRFDRKSGKVHAFRPEKFGGNTVFEFSDLNPGKMNYLAGIIFYGPTHQMDETKRMDYIYMDLPIGTDCAFYKYINTYMEKGFDGVTPPNLTIKTDRGLIHFIKSIRFDLNLRMSTENSLDMQMDHSRGDTSNHTVAAALDAIGMINFAWLGYLLTFLPCRQQGFRAMSEGADADSGWNMLPTPYQRGGMILGAMANLVVLSLLIGTLVLLGLLFGA